MRWFVEVSHLDGEFAEEKLCVEAKQWQAALQQARKLRGDSGPLSAFSIELLDNGYRAVNLGRKLRYVVLRAPVDAKLSTPDSIAKAREQASNGKSAARAKAGSTSNLQATKARGRGAGPASRAGSGKAKQVKDFKTGAKKLTGARATGAKAGTPSEPPKSFPAAVTKPPTATKSPSLKPRTTPAPAAAKGTSSRYPSAGLATGPPSQAPRPSSSAPASRRGSMAARMITIQPDSSPAPASSKRAAAEDTSRAGGVEGSNALASKAALAPSSAPELHSVAPEKSSVAEAVPTFQIIRTREVEPTQETPLVYREVAYAVADGSSRAQVEALLRQQFDKIKSSLAQKTQGKLVQLAVFDHVFDRKPHKAPLATLIWKEWRGEPKLEFPAAGTPATSLRPPDVSMPPRPAGVSTAPASNVLPAETVPTGKAAAPPDAAPRADEVTTLPQPASESSAAQESSAELEAGPMRRRGPDVDLIGELFETMHELHFFQDIVAGADFVVRVLEETIPSRLVFVHVFDINTRDFVLVRQSGSTDDVLLQRVPDTDPLFDQVMHLGRVRIGDASSDARFQNGRWATTGSPPGAVLCGAVRQGGRYLGAIELADPLGKQPYFETEANALEYICGQFAEFIANRPIVMDAEAVLGQS